MLATWIGPVSVAASLLVAVAIAFVRQFEVTAPQVQPDARPQRIVMIVVDGLRHDRISALGYPRPTTPNLDRLTGAATFFERCQSQASTTLASNATLLTGMHPRSHAVRHTGHALPEACVTLAEALRQSGFRTAAFLDAPELSRAPEYAARLDQGFDVFDAAEQPDAPENSGFARYYGAVCDFLLRSRAERSFTYIETRATCAPFFAEESDRSALSASSPVVPNGARSVPEPLTYLAALSTHDSLRPENYTSVDEIVDAYDAAVHRVDRQIAAVLQFLIERGLFDDALIVVTSGHGLSLLDRGIYVGNGLSVYQEEVAVPLWIRFPHGRHAGKRVSSVVRSMDVLPTICELAGVARPSEVDGESLLELVTSEGAPRDRIASGEAVALAAKGVDGVPGYTFYRRDSSQKWIAPSRIRAEDLYSLHLDHARAEVVRAAKVVATLGIDARFVSGVQEFDLASDPLESANRSSGIDSAFQAIEELERNDEIPRERKRERLKRASESAAASDSGETEASIRKLVEEKYIDEAEGDRRIRQLRRNNR